MSIKKYHIQLFLLFVLVMLSRVPFLNHGYGLDPDAYRITAAGQYIAETEKFICLRPPCHPLPVLTYAALVPTSSLVFNTITAILGALAAAAFSLALKMVGARNSLIAGAALAAVPLIYINSTNSMDYIWALSFALFSVCAATWGYNILAGVMLGIAAGCRLEYAAMLVPVLGFLAITNQGRRRVFSLVKLSLSTVLSTALAFSPVLYNFGTKVILSKFKITLDISQEKFIDQATFSIFGGLGVLSLLCLTLITVVLAFGSSRTRRAWRVLPKPKIGWSLMCLTAVVIYVWGYSRAPFESGYLISAVPFVIGLFVVVLGETPLGRHAVTASLILILLSPFFFNATYTSNLESLDYRIILSESPGRSINFQKSGPLFVLQEKREREKRRYDRMMSGIVALSRRSSKNIAIVAGSMRPRLQAEWCPAIGPHVELVELVKTPKQMEDLKKRTEMIYYLPGVSRYNRSSYKIDLRAHGAVLFR